jgi:hypothetical protein
MHEEAPQTILSIPFGPRDVRTQSDRAEDKNKKQNTLCGHDVTRSNLCGLALVLEGFLLVLD